MRQPLARLLIVIAGLVACQIALYWPSLLGKKVLLPLDILCSPGVYLPQTAENEAVTPQDSVLLDLVYLFEPTRQFAVAELHAGRIPSWAPYEYAGVPFIWPKYSLFLLLACTTASPLILAWTQLLASTLAGLGAFCFFRLALGLRFWAATFAAWCFPLTGFLIFWQGYPTCGAVFWLPWLLLAVHKTLARPTALRLAGLSVATALTLLGGHIDVGAQVLLVSGLYALWWLMAKHGTQWQQPRFPRAIACLVFGWLLGVLLASPYLLPVLEYTRTSSRLEHRRLGQEERPPIGLAALPEILMPDMYGSKQRGSFTAFPDRQTTQQDSPAAAYTGMIATLVAAPLAWCGRHRRWRNLGWLALAFFGLSWTLGVPGITHLLRLPGLNLLSHVRLVFATSFSILALAATGLDELLRGNLHWRRSFQLPCLVLVAIGGWCLFRIFFPPEPIATQLGQAVISGNRVGPIQDLAGVTEVQNWFLHAFAHSVILCAVGLAGWHLLRRAQCDQGTLAVALGLLMCGELLWFAYGRNPQCEPGLYYPELPVLRQLAQAAPGRMLGYACLPANLAETHGLRDIRGYDGVDPASMVELLQLAAAPDAPAPRYAVTQWLIPQCKMAPPDGIKLSPILDMLGVRYVVFRGSPNPDVRPFLQDQDYWVLVNHNALPRAFVPERVEIIPDKQQRLAKLASEQFNPREVAYVEQPVALPAAGRGEAKVLDEIPTQVRLATQMQTTGLVVLADRWDKGWRAYLDGQQASILRVNHALRGVVVPAGQHTLVFRYQPASFKWGLGLAISAAVVLIGVVRVHFLPSTRDKP